MTYFKSFTFLVVSGYIIFQLFLITQELSGPKIITVYKRNYPDLNAYVKGYKTEKGSIEKFEVKVKPNGFWDSMLLTHEDDNLLCDILKIGAGLAFAYYVYNLSYDNIFSNKSFNLFWLIMCFCVFNYIAYSVGTSHTNDFFRDLYMANGGDEITMYDFQPRAKMNTIAHDWWIYYFIPLIIINLYKTFRNHHEGRLEDDWS